VEGILALTKLRVILATLEPRLADAWRREFHDVADVEIHPGSIFEVDADALVSPANSFGFMDGGIDALYSQEFGWDLQLRLRRLIQDFHHGELLIGAAETVATGSGKHPYLIAAPTMRVPMILDRKTINPFLATRAALLLATRGTFHAGPLAGMKLHDHIRTIAFPGMGTGVGQVSATLCARQMRRALGEVLKSDSKMPESWAEASEQHQLLYTNRPKRLQ
jgi:O-acetyl-ADP-ribose deacetylase (regulator of RNase III)